MELFLTSQAKDSNVRQPIIDYVEGFDDKNVVYIPTAAHAEQGFGLYQSGGTFKTLEELSPNLTTLELEFVTNKEAQETIESADILFMAGGFPVYLSYWLHRRRLRDLMYNRIKAGMYYIGPSAGAMVCAQSLKASPLLSDDVFGDVAPGLGFINYEIWPHYEDEHQDVLEKHFEEGEIKVLRDGEYIIEEIL